MTQVISNVEYSILRALGTDADFFVRDGRQLH